MPNTAGKVAIGKDGTVAVDGERIATLGLAQFKVGDLQKRRVETAPIGWRTAPPSQQLENPDVRQGFLEMANVGPHDGVIKTNRMFEFNTALSLRPWMNSVRAK